MDFKTAWSLVSETIADYGEDRAMRRGASLAYYSVFSLAPLVSIAIAIAGLVFDRTLVTGYVFRTMSDFMGPLGAGAVRAAVLNAQNPKTGTAVAVISVVLFFLGSAGVFNQLKSALNAIWGVAPRPARTVEGAFRQIFIKNFLSLTLVLGTGFLLAVSLLLDTAFAAISGYLSLHVPGGVMLWGVVNNLVTFGVLALLFAMMFKYLPDARIAWREVWLGAILTALLFDVGKVAIGVYIGHSSLSSSYGAATSLVVLLLWVFYSAQILFIGAEFTKVYADRCGERILPARGAIAVTTEAQLAQQGKQAHSSRRVELQAQRQMIENSLARIRGNLARIRNHGPKRPPGAPR